jgi:hypothetical protein
MARKKRIASTARRLHRTLGAGAAAFVIFMVLSGLLINHSSSLGLDDRHVSQSFLLDWYGLGRPQHIQSFAVGENWLSFAGSQLYLNEQLVSSISSGVGAVLSGDILVAAGNDELLLLEATGELIERQAWDTTNSGPIDAIGLMPDGRVVLKSKHQLWLSDVDFIGWEKTMDKSIRPGWSLPVSTPESLLQSITRQYRGEGPSQERLLLDLHSGRLFGPLGILVYDLLALVLGFLAVSGLILWFRGQRNGKQKSSRTKRP